MLLSIFHEFYMYVEIGGINFTYHGRVHFTILRIKILMIINSNIHITLRERFLNSFILEV